MNSKPFRVLSLTLLIAGCSPAAPLTQPGNSQSTLQTSNKIAHTSNTSGDKVSVKVQLPASAQIPFRTQAAQTAQAVYVRLTIKAVDLQREYTNAGGVSLNGLSNLVAFSGGSATLTVEEIPPGKNRIVIAQLYDAEGKELTSLRSMGLYHSHTATVTASRFTDADPGTNVIEQTVSRRNVPLLSTLEQAIDSKDTAFIAQVENHLEALATEFDKLLYGANPPGSTFVNEPQRIDPSEVYTAMKTQLQTAALTLPTGLPTFFTVQTPSIVDSTSNVTVHLATPTGFSFTQNLTVVIDDPGSTPVTLNATGMSSPQSITLNNVERGSRRLTVYGPGNLVLGHTTVTVDPDTGISFAGNAGSSPASPLFLIGGETGIVISSLSLNTAIAGTPLTINGIGYAASPNHSDNSVKFGSTVAPNTTATTSTVNLLTPDLTAGTYPVTLTRLGVTSNFMNFNLLPSISSLSGANGIVGSSLTLTGTGFSPTAANNTVKFGTVNATVTNAAPDGHSLTVTVPANIWQSPNVSATIGGLTSTELRPFAVRPVITSLSSTGATIGTVLTINGTGFDPTPANNAVLFGSTPATVSSAQPDQLIVTVPPGIWGTRNVTVAVGSQTSAASPFAVKPQITDTTPNKGIPGIFITLIGTGFDPTEANNTVKFGSIFLGQATANVNNATTTSLNVTVFPVIVGNLPVTVQVGSQISDGSIFESVFPPAITSLSQSSGPIGTVIQINGEHFGPTPASNTVKFGNVNATVTAASATQLTVSVPVGATGTNAVTVAYDGNTSNGVNFTGVPTLSSVSPTAAMTGEDITLTGSGFTPNPSVTVGGIPATIVGTPTNTSIVVKVPGPVADWGPKQVNVTVAGQNVMFNGFSKQLASPCVQNIAPTVGDPLYFYDCFDNAPIAPHTAITQTGNRFGQGNKAYGFNGSTSFLSLAQNISPSVVPELTVSIWARAAFNEEGVHALVGQDNTPWDRAIMIDNRGSSGFGWSAFAGGTAQVIGGGNYSQGIWTMLTAVYSQSAQTVRFYVNGVLTGSANGVTMTDGTAHLMLGKHATDTNEFFNGDIDDLQIFNQALDSLHVQELYNRTKPLVID